MALIKIAVIAGTSEATEIINAVSYKYCVTAFVATELGRTILNNCKCHISSVRLDERQFTKYFSENAFKAIIDASHPFAVEVSENVKKASQTLNIPYIRVTREAMNYDYNKVIHTDNKESAVRILNNIEGNIFFTTGSNTLKFYAENVCGFKERAIARVLDTDFSRNAIRGLENNIIYGNPPFSLDNNLKIIIDYNISIMISKDSSKRGGLYEKVEASQIRDIPIIIIDSPERATGGITSDNVLAILESRLKAGYPN